MPFPTAPFLVRRRYLVVVPRPLPAAPLDVRRKYFIVMLRPVLRPFVACGDATLPQQEKNTRQMSRGAELTLPASCEHRQGYTRSDVPSARWGRWT